VCRETLKKVRLPSPKQRKPKKERGREKDAAITTNAKIR
jgi:hypothetical protein